MTERVLTARTLMQAYGLELATSARARAVFSRELGKKLAQAVLDKVKGGIESGPLKEEVARLIAEARENELDEVEATTVAAAIMMARLAKEILACAELEAQAHEASADALEQIRSLPPE